MRRGALDTGPRRAAHRPATPTEEAPQTATAIVLAASGESAIASVPDLLRGRLDAAIARLAPSSRRTYRAALGTFAAWFAEWLPTAPPPLPSLLDGAAAGSAEWSGIVLALLAAGPLVSGTVADAFASASSNHAPATVAVRLAALRWAFRVARDAGAVAWDLRVRSPRVRPLRDTRGPGLPAARRMLAVADEEAGIIGARDGVLLALLLGLALRRGEIVGLDVAHFDREGERLSVRGKGHGDREWITLPPPVAERLARYLDERGSPPAGAPLVASCPRAKKREGRLTASGIFRRVVRLARLAGVSRQVSPHRLRHTSITAALDAFRGDVRRVRQFSRHAKIETVLVYDDAREDVGGEVAAAVAGVVGIRVRAGVDGPRSV